MTRAGDAPRSRPVVRLIALEQSVRSLYCSRPVSTCSPTWGATSAESPIASFERSSSTRAARSCIGSSSGCTDCTRARCSSPGFAALGYGLLELVEGVGLWLDQVRAEYVTVIATSLLLPQLYELARKPSLLKAAGIAVNIAIVAYLAGMFRRRLARGAAPL